MHWHAQPTRLTLRLFAPGRSFDAHDTPAASCQVDLLACGRAYVHAAMRHDGAPLMPPEWRALAELLRDRWGVATILADRRGRWVEIDTGRA